MEERAGGIIISFVGLDIIPPIWGHRKIDFTFNQKISPIKVIGVHFMHAYFGKSNRCGNL